MTHNRHSNKDHLKMTLKRNGYALFLVPTTLPVVCYYIWSSLSETQTILTTNPNLYAWLPLLVMFVAIPLLDALIGKDPDNPSDQEAAELSSQLYYRFLLYLNLPVSIVSLVVGIILFVHWTELTLVGQTGLIASFGTIHSGTMINVAHELIHKTSKSEQRMGGILLSMVMYPGFKIEHIRGHHIHVATPNDSSTSRLGQTLYNFLGQAIYNNILTAWSLEATLLRKRGLSVLSWNNELLRWYTLVGIMLIGITLIFGLAGLVFFFAQSVVAVMLLEAVNYLEHYGLKRQLQSNGRYERTSHQHSWNSNYLLSNLISFQLQRHSDHHANPQRRYQVLRHFDDSPQLPAGYSAMIILAAIPPLWMRVMNPRVQRYYENEPHE